MVNSQAKVSYRLNAAGYRIKNKYAVVDPNTVNTKSKTAEKKNKLQLKL